MAINIDKIQLFKSIKIIWQNEQAGVKNGWNHSKVSTYKKTLIERHYYEPQNKL